MDSNGTARQKRYNNSYKLLYSCGKENKEVDEMLKLTVEAGEYLMIGDDIKVVFAGGTSRHARVLVDAPKSLKVLRSNAIKVVEGGAQKEPVRKYKKERELSPEARAKINAILAEERKRIKMAEG